MFIEEIIGATIVTAIAAVSVSGYRVFGISIANVISVLLILILAWKNGLLGGSTIGVSLGLILGIIGVVTPIQILAFAISGLLAGATNKLGRIGVVAGFLVGNAIISYLGTGNTVQVLLYKELLISGIALFFVPKYVQIDIEGIIENMSGFVCPCCNTLTPIFNQGGGEKTAKEFNIPLLGKIPIEPALVQSCDSGEVYASTNSKTATGKIFAEIAEGIISKDK